MISEYDRYFKQELLSDCDLVISWPKSDCDAPRDAECPMDCCSVEDQPAPDENQDKDAELPRGSYSFPAHQLLLFKSSHFEAQGLRWQQPPVTDIQATQQAASNQHESSATVAGHLRTQLVLSIDHEEQLPAAEAVIAALYGVESCFSSLPHDQLVHALVIADRIDLPGVAEQIIAALKTAAITPAGLSSTALETMANLSAWPDCMYQILPPILNHFTQHKLRTATTVQGLTVVLAADTNELHRNVMLAAFGDLQAVWKNPSVSQLLMKLPLPAIQLLLSSDKLQVPSEDVVLYTVEQYYNTLPFDIRRRRSERITALSSLVRAPCLSDFALQSVSLANSLVWSLLVRHPMHQDRLRQLISLKRAIGGVPAPSELGVLYGAPKSWLQGPRSLVPEEPASVVWRLPVEQLINSCRKAAEHKTTEKLRGPDSPPMGALAWRMDVRCNGQEDGTTLGLFVGPRKTISDVYRSIQYCIVYNKQHRDNRSKRMVVGRHWGWPDFFAIGPMAGGWDAAAWTAKGLPTSGDLILELRMLKIW